MSQSSKLLHEALALPPAERAHLAATLISSLEETDEGDVEQAWKVEVATRIRSLDSGKTSTVEWVAAKKQIVNEAP